MLTSMQSRGSLKRFWGWRTAAGCFKKQEKSILKKKEKKKKHDPQMF
jgi:hypothetical protein